MIRLPAVNHSANQSSFCDACVVPEACAVTGPTLAHSVMFGAPVLVSLSDLLPVPVAKPGKYLLPVPIRLSVVFA